MDVEMTSISPFDNEENMLYGGVSGTQCKLLDDHFDQIGPIGCQSSSSLKREVVLNYDEEEFSFTKDTCLNTVAGIDNSKHLSNNTLKIESLFEVDTHSVFEDHQRQQEINLSSEETILPCPSYPQKHSCNVRFLSSFLTQHRNHSFLPLDNWTQGEKAYHNVRMIPVLRQLVTPVSRLNNFICYDQWREGVISGPVQSPDLPASSEALAECYDGLHSSPHGSGDDGAEVKLAVASILDSNKEQAVFQDPNTNEMSYTLLPSQEQLEEAIFSKRKDSSSVVFCHLKGATPLLCLNNPGTSELKMVHMVPPFQGQHKPLHSSQRKVDVANQVQDISPPLSSAVGRFLPGPATPNLGFEQLDNGALLSLVNNAVLTNLQGPSKISVSGGPVSNWDAKSKKPCNCTKSQCLKLPALIEIQKLSSLKLVRGNWEILNHDIIKAAIASGLAALKIIVSAMRLKSCVPQSANASAVKITKKAQIENHL
ncbi:tesmin isoform X2 [Lissotriton helveticus]